MATLFELRHVAAMDASSHSPFLNLVGEKDGFMVLLHLVLFEITQETIIDLFTRMAAPKQSYIYQPLTSSHHIRVAEIQPGIQPAPLNIKLREILLPSGRKQQCSDKYQTLSYEWGDGSRSNSLLCDGETLLITINLQAALQRLRSPTETLILWIDSICIDQENLRERNFQVSLMPLIYKSATRVFMWIGEETADTPIAMKKMDKLGSLLNLIEEKYKASDLAQNLMLTSHAPTLASLNALKKVVGDSSPVDLDEKQDWNVLNDLFSRSYFERTWIAQEVLLSWNATVVCGARRFSWLDLRNAVICVSTCPFLPIKNETRSYLQLMMLAGLHACLPAFRHSFYRPRKMILIDLLLFLRFSLCRDPRDYVYGLIGMAAYPYGGIGHSDPVDVGLPPPDYSKPVEDIYQETTVALIQQDKNLRIFYCIGVPSFRPYSNMPTWVIDWSHSQEGHAHLQTAPTPHASKELFPGDIHFSARLLITEGICFSTVAYVSDAIQQNDIIRRICKISRKLEDIYGNTFFTKYANGQAVTHAFVKTLLMNTDDIEAAQRGLNNEGEGGDWTLMYNSFLGTLALEGVSEKLTEHFHESWREYVMTKAISDLGAGLFLSAAQRLQNNRFFTLENGLMGLGNLEVEQGDSIVVLKGSIAPLVLRRRPKDGGDWMIVGEAYIHAAMEVNPDVYTEQLLQSWREYRIN
jgi:hypothetical protein